MSGILLTMNKNLTSLSLTSHFISVKSIKTHFYFSMKNCDKDPEKLRKSLKNIVEHYKVFICFIKIIKSSF